MLTVSNSKAATIEASPTSYVPLPGLLRLRKTHRPIGTGHAQGAGAAVSAEVQGISRTHTAKWCRSQHARPISLPLHIRARQTSTSMTAVQADLDQLEAQPGKKYAIVTMNWLASLPDMLPICDLCFTGSILRTHCVHVVWHMQHLFSLSAPGSDAHHLQGC